MESALAVLRRRAGTIAQAIAARAPADSIRVIFAGGSVARGRVWAAEVDGVLEVYSDIDLYVVVREAARADEVRLVARAVLAQAGDGIPGVRFVRGVEVGVYTGEDLCRQPLRPGTADLHLRHVLLYGNAAEAQALLARPERRMEPAEALYLLENRAWDASGQRPADSAGERLRRVLSLKLDLDIAAAYMIVAGLDAVSVCEPAEALRAGAGMVTDAQVLEAAWRADVARGNLRAFLGAPAPRGEPSRARVARAWLALAPAVLGVAGAGALLLAYRSGEGRRLENAREFVRVAARAGLPRWRALLAAPASWERSPVTTLRVYALARALAEDGPDGAFEGHLAFAGRLAERLGFRSGTRDERVAQARAAVC